MTYPSGYKLDYNYNSGLDNNISRLSSLVEDSTLTTLESYQYLGLDTVVERDHPQNHVNLTYIEQGNDPNANHDGGDQYTGLDRFGRVIDQNWVNTSTGQSTDRFQYGYNQDSDVLYRQNLVNATMSELYQYDNLHQLTNFQRGTLNATHNGIVGTPSSSQSWNPDALGNFSSVTTNGTAQTRTHNQQNEITGISGAGAVTYDANGNLTADGSGNTYVYDPWNRLVKVNNGSTTLAAYGYDGLNRRITETHGSNTTDLYYSANWQVLEERVNGQLQARYVWSPLGVDTLVLRDDSSQGNGTLDRRLYVQQDAIGNVTALVDVNGNVVERYDYAPFGAVTVLNPDFSLRGVSSYGWLYFFQGKRYDGAVGLYDSRERVYSPTLMRPLQTDPSGQAAGVNLYDWEGNDPTNAIDPTGLTAAEPTAPPKDFDKGLPDESKVGANWKIAETSAGDVLWMTSTGTLNGYIFLKDPSTVIHFGHCFWVNGFNTFQFSVDKNSRVSRALFFNVEPFDPEDKDTFTRAVKKFQEPIDTLYRSFPNKGTDEEKQAAREKIGKAQERAMSQLQAYYQENAKLFIKSDGSGNMVIRGKKRDLVPDKGYYNALMYEWTRKDNKIVVYRLKAPEKEGDKAKWVIYKKIKGNGELSR